MSTCPKCNNHTFTIQENTPAGSNFKLMFVQCSSCGAVVGVIDCFNIGNLILQQNKALKKIAGQLDVHVDLD